MQRMPCTISILERDGKILLGMKKRGMGKGRWNGLGGKIESGETLEESALREIAEESGVTHRSYQKVGEVLFHIPSNDLEVECHIFRVTEFDGEPAETEEMTPAWFPPDRLPLEEMWPGDRLWLPFYLGRKPFRGEVFYGLDGEVIKHTIAGVAE